MYQALYRKWRPKTFDDVVGQSHITDTLKQQVARGRPSHAYLFTGTRGTGKTSCAKILSRAVNCEQVQGGNPCNACPACLGIESGAILDVLELDAASNNGVDQVRALRDEAVYTPAAVRKRVYIIDEVHMLSTAAFNALLKILEEPPAHLMFILATTELHKVPATIRSRCQQFAFKRILPGQIAQQLIYVAEQEQISLSQEGAVLLARLADGGLRDGLSLLDQCAAGSRQVGETEILDTLGLAGNLETAQLMEYVAARNTTGALETLARLYAGGKDVGSVLHELAGLARDLLLRKTAPQSGGTLLTGGYDETTMRGLGEKLTAQRLLLMLTLLQATCAELPRSSNRRTDAELCLIRLCDERLDESLAGLSARIAQLEERVGQSNGTPVHTELVVDRPVAGTEPIKKTRKAVAPKEGYPSVEPEAFPVSEEKNEQYRGEERPPLPEEPPEASDYMLEEPTPAYYPKPEPEKRTVPAPRRTRKPAAPESAPVPVVTQEGENRAFWPSFAAGLRGKITPAVMPYLNHPDKVLGIWNGGTLTLWVDSELTRKMVDRPAVLEVLAKEATRAFGVTTQVSVRKGKPPEPAEQSFEMQSRQAEGEPNASGAEESDAMDALIAFGSQFDNIIIQE